MSSIGKTLNKILGGGDDGAAEAARRAEAEANRRHAETLRLQELALAQQGALSSEANAIQAEMLLRNEQANQIQQQMASQAQAEATRQKNLMAQQDPLENVAEVVPGGGAEAGDQSGDLPRNRRRRSPLSSTLGLTV